MEIGRIKGCTRVIGKSQGYLGLPLRDVLIDDSVNGPSTPAMETAWFPTPDELAALNAGAPVVLRVLGTGHPPVMLTTGDLPDDAAVEPRDLEKPMLVFQYRNWRDEVAERHVIPQKVWWGATEWHPHGCWLLSAYDLDKQALRDFDIRGVNAPELFGKISDAPAVGRERMGQLIYEAVYADQGGKWSAVEPREVWYAKADWLMAQMAGPPA